MKCFPLAAISLQSTDPDADIREGKAKNKLESVDNDTGDEFVDELDRCNRMAGRCDVKGPRQASTGKYKTEAGEVND